MNIKKNLINLAVCTVLSGTALYAPSSLAIAPTLNLFPTSVVANLQTSAASAEEMENSMESIVVQMENQAQLYKDSQCESGSLDAGCAQIKKGLATSYTKMLDKMGDQLPVMKQAMQSTVNVLGKNIRTELGKKMTMRDLQRVIQGKTGAIQSARKRSGKKAGRMSASLKKYHSMITLNSNQSPSQALLAAEIYADASEALDYISLLQMQIDQSKIIMGVGNIWNGEPSEQMMATVSSVKALLFGEVETDLIPDTLMQNIDPAKDDSAWIID